MRVRLLASVAFLMFVACTSAGTSVLVPPATRPASLHAHTPVLSVVYRFRGQPDGETPIGAMVDAGGTLYGVTQSGGDPICQCGTVFSYSPTVHVEKILTTFKGQPDGSEPYGKLAYYKGALYGATYAGGSQGYGNGTIFRLAISGGKWVKTILYNFTGGTDGKNPRGLVADGSGNFYGIAETGGGPSDCCGAVFKFSIAGGSTKLTPLKQFPQSSAASIGLAPVGDVLLVGNTLYGTLSSGGIAGANCGSGGCGALFSIATNGSAFKTLYRFKGPPDGSSPASAMVAGPNNVLYGSAVWGGTSTCNPPFGCGAVFSLTPSGNGYTEKIIRSFQGLTKDGSFPGDLLYYNGALWGTTASGGCCTYGGDNGVVYELVPSGPVWNEQWVQTFSYKLAKNPSGALTVDGGVLYGPASIGGILSTPCPAGCGSILKITP